MSDAFYTITVALGYGKITVIPLVVHLYFSHRMTGSPGKC